eukprot:23775-Chlamydomonas_euryale.AAC.1
MLNHEFGFTTLHCASICFAPFRSTSRLGGGPRLVCLWIGCWFGSAWLTSGGILADTCCPPTTAAYLAWRVHVRAGCFVEPSQSVEKAFRQGGLLV